MERSAAAVRLILGLTVPSLRMLQGSPNTSESLLLEVGQHSAVVHSNCRITDGLPSPGRLHPAEVYVPRNKEIEAR